VNLLGFSPITHFLVVVVSCLVIVYLMRDPLDRVFPGFKADLDSMVMMGSQGISQTFAAVETAADTLYTAAVRTASSHSWSVTPEASDSVTRVLRLPYFAKVPARPRLAVSYLEGRAGLRECEDGCYLVRMPDASLEPTIKKGQLLLIDSRRTAVSGDVVWAAYGGRPYLRRFFRTGAVARLAPDNPSYPEIREALRDIHINGVFLRVAD